MLVYSRLKVSRCRVLNNSTVVCRFFLTLDYCRLGHLSGSLILHCASFYRGILSMALLSLQLIAHRFMCEYVDWSRETDD